MFNQLGIIRSITLGEGTDQRNLFVVEGVFAYIPGHIAGNQRLQQMPSLDIQLFNENQNGLTLLADEHTGANLTVPL